MQGGELLETIISLFKSLGYRVQYKLLNAADYGAPQIRERVVIIGSKLKTDFQYPEPTHYNPEEMPDLFNKKLKPYLTLEEAISDLPFIKSSEESLEYASKPQNDFQRFMRKNAPTKLMDHNSPNNNANLVKIMELLPDGGTPEDLPENLRPKSGFKNTYCRLWWKRPATTITRNLSTPSSSRCIHPKLRDLSRQERAQEFNVFQTIISFMVQGVIEIYKSETPCQHFYQTHWQKRFYLTSSRKVAKVMDKFSKQKRSEIMSKIRSSNTKFERKFVVALKN